MPQSRPLHKQMVVGRAKCLRVARRPLSPAERKKREREKEITKERTKERERERDRERDREQTNKPQAVVTLKVCYEKHECDRRMSTIVRGLMLQKQSQLACFDWAVHVSGGLLCLQLQGEVVSVGPGRSWTWFTGTWKGSVKNSQVGLWLEISSTRR